MSVKELRILCGWSQQKFGDYFHIPRRTIQNWEAEVNKCNDYIVELMAYKLRKEGIIE